MISLKDKIVNDLNIDGIASCSLEQILSAEDLKHFDRVNVFYKDFLADKKIRKRLDDVNNGVPNPLFQKWYQISVNEFLGRKLTLGDPIMDLYTSNAFIEIAKTYLNDDRIRIRNVDGWIHPRTDFKKEIHSQRWHRDQEDFKLMKVFILLNDIGEDNGPTEFIKQTQYGGDLEDITYNMTWLDYYKKPTLYKKLKNAYVKRFSRYKFRYQPPKDNFVKAIGSSGTVYFINSNGLHKGGFVKEGQRHLLHGAYLRSDAPMIQYNKLRKFNNSINQVEFNQEEFLQLNDQQKGLFK